MSYLSIILPVKRVRSSKGDLREKKGSMPAREVALRIHPKGPRPASPHQTPEKDPESRLQGSRTCFKGKYFAK